MKNHVAWAASLVLAAIAGQGLGQAVKPASPGPADLDRMIELLRTDVRAQKADLISKNVSLDASQAAAFWPVYKAYEAERRTLGDERIAVIKEYAEHYEKLDDARARSLIDRMLAVDERRVAVQKKYKDEFLKVLPGKVVARFFQVESRLDNLINLEVSSQIPLVTK